MRRNPALHKADLLESIAGEEDPGAALDMARAIMDRATPDAVAFDAPTIHLECREGSDQIEVDVGWPTRGSGSAAELLGLVVAHHGEIADAAWSAFARTGARSIELAIDESNDGMFYVSRRDA